MKHEFDNPSSTVDLIVPYQGGLVLIKRKHGPFRNYWALPGGFIERGKETLEEAGVRELFEETSLSAETKNLTLVGVYSSPERDPRGHVISHAYHVRDAKGSLRANDDASEAHVFNELPDKLAFDHETIIKQFLKTSVNTQEVFK